jgi:hypothetical protein
MMDKALKLTLEDIGTRLKTLIPIWILGTGANFGRLNCYARTLSFALISKLFYQELLDDSNRTREDMIKSVEQLAGDMFVECDPQEAEKIVDALMVNEASTKHTFAFQEQFFNERSKQWETFRFQFLEIDRDSTDFENGTPVYKLSQEAQEMFLNTNDIQKHLPISIQQLLVELLIEKGELKVALRMLDALNHRVMTLLKEEKIHKDELIRNPKRTLFENKNKWGNQLKEVELQFAEEAKKYQKLERILRKIAVSPEHQDTYLQLMKRVTKTRLNHDQLANLVIENIRLELQIRTTNFRNMWLTNTTSFRKTIWENKAQIVGFADPDDMISLAESLFSPHKPSMLPLEWGIQDQIELSFEPAFAGSGNANQHLLEPVELDWESILSLWKPIFEELLKNGMVSLKYLQEIDEFSFARWVQNHEAFDFWLAFASMEEPFVVNEDNLQSDSDDKALLISKLLALFPTDFLSLWNKKIRSIPTQESMILRSKIDVSTYILILEEEEEIEPNTSTGSSL